MGDYMDVAAFNGPAFLLLVVALSIASLASVAWTLGLLETSDLVLWTVMVFSSCGVMTELLVAAAPILSSSPDFGGAMRVAAALSWLDTPGRAAAEALGLGVDRWAVGLTKPFAPRIVGGICWTLTANVMAWALLGRAVAEAVLKRRSRI